MARYEIEGMRELERTIKTLGILPQKCVNTAARKGIVIARKSAKQGGWIDQTGNLRRGIIQKAERTRVRGKKVYDVMMNPQMNDIFQKKTKTGMRVVRTGSRSRLQKGNYYYPASQEYGFRTRNGGYVPGFHFLKRALEGNKFKIEREVVSVLTREIDKLR